MDPGRSPGVTRRCPRDVPSQLAVCSAETGSDVIYGLPACTMCIYPALLPVQAASSAISQRHGVNAEAPWIHLMETPAVKGRFREGGKLSGYGELTF